MDYLLPKDSYGSIKGFVLAALRGQLGYKHFRALTDVSANISKGDVVGLVGCNGAGKSTLLKVVAGIMKPTEGRVTIRGGVAPMLELGSGFDSDLTGLENIGLNGAIIGYTKEEVEKYTDSIIEFSELKDFINAPLRTYSSGMVARLAFSIATMRKPDILIVDEVLSVGDAAFRAKCMNRMKELMDGDTTVFFVSHSIESVQDICNKAIWLDLGRVVAYGEAGIVCNAYSQVMANKLKVPDGMSRYDYVRQLSSPLLSQS
jgi:ABC-2 type transport system ATP-binding protein/lipopolysaccharide transport system ATP-binding protein